VEQNEESGDQWQTEDYQEPDDFAGYIRAIMNHEYAPGMYELDYLMKAYALYLDGKHNDDFFNIGLMWYHIYDSENLYVIDASLTKSGCLEEAIKAYQEYEALYGGGAAVYSNLALIYLELGDREAAREYTNKALGYEKEQSYALSNFLWYLYFWIDDEDYEVLMEDAEMILTHEKNLSMYLLYGACAAAANRNVEKAYNLLCEADTYFGGKSAMVKILRCICAELISINDIPLHEIYELEDAVGLTKEEETYLIRFLFATNRYEELWGYLADVGTDENAGLEAEMAAIKSSWYFRNPDFAQSEIENVKLLLQCVNNQLDHVEQTEDKELLLLSQILLKNYLGEPEIPDIEVNEEEIPDLQYVFLATNAFNEAEYENAIKYCEAFFAAEKNTSASTAYRDVFSLHQLEPQERMALHYYIQLIFAHAHFECAKEFRRGSDEWKNHMETSERECAVFEQSSKSFFYISEQFRMLKNSIDLENGKLPQETEEDGKSKIEVSAPEKLTLPFC